MRNSITYRFEFFNFNFYFNIEEKERLPIAANEELVIAAVAEGGAEDVVVVGLVAISDGVGVEEEVVVLVRDVIGGLAVESFGD